MIVRVTKMLGKPYWHQLCQLLMIKTFTCYVKNHLSRDLKYQSFKDKIKISLKRFQQPQTEFHQHVKYVLGSAINKSWRHRPDKRFIVFFLLFFPQSWPIKTFLLPTLHPVFFLGFVSFIDSRCFVYFPWIPRRIWVWLFRIPRGFRCRIAVLTIQVYLPFTTSPTVIDLGQLGRVFARRRRQ